MTVVSDNDVGARACAAEESLFGGSIEKPTVALHSYGTFLKPQEVVEEGLHKTVGQQVRSR